MINGRKFLIPTNTFTEEQLHKLISEAAAGWSE